MNELQSLSVKFKIDLSEFQKGIEDVKKGLNSIGKIPTSTKAFNDMSKDVTRSFNNISKQSSKASKNIAKDTNSMVKNILRLNKSMSAMARFGRFFAFSYLGRQLVGLTKNMMIAGANMTEIQNLFEVSFGSMTKKAEEFAKTLENAWGVSATLTKQQTAYLNNMLKSMGMAKDMAFGMSTGLVQLSHNIASLYDISQEDALYKLRSAMVGVSRPLLQLGINTKVAELQQVAFRNGITSTNRELTQQEKILATYWAIYEQTRSAWASGYAIVDGQKVAIGDMTKTIGTNANMVRVLSNRLKDLGRIWGLAFQPVVTYVLPMLYKLIEALTNVGRMFAIFMGRLFGFDISSFEELMKVNEFQGAGVPSDNGLADYYDDVAESADKAKKATDKLTGSIDELNILSEPNTNGANGGFDPSMGGIENNIGLPNMDEIIGGTIDATVNKRIEAIKKKLLELIEPLKQIGVAMLGAFATIGVITGVVLLVKNFEMLAYQFKLFQMSVAQFGLLKTIFGGLGASISALASPLGIVIVLVGVFVASFVYLMTTSEEFRNNIIGYLTEIGQKFAMLGANIYKNFIEPVVGYFAWFIQNIWDNGLGTLVEKLSYLILEFVNMIMSFFNFLSITVLPLVSNFVGLVLSALSPIINFITGILSTVVDVFTGVIRFVSDVFMGDWDSAWKSLFNIFINLINASIGAVERFINFFIDGINALIGSFQWMNPLLGAIGIPQITSQTFNRVEFGRVPKLASGGIAYGETMAIVGEYQNAKSDPEVISPLSKLKTMIGDGYTSEEQNGLLREVVAILRAILDKDTNVVLDGRTLAKAIDKAKSKLGYAIMR